MSLDVPASALTTQELAKLAGFDRTLANSIDTALAQSGTILVDGTTIGGDGISTALHTIANSNPVNGFPVFNVKDYGATGNGSTDDRAAIQSAIAAAQAATGGIIYFPVGTYIVGRNGTNAYCLDITGDNISLIGIKGSVIKAKAGLPASSVAVIRVNEHDGFTMSGVTVDGNWGNVVTTIASTSHNVALPTATVNVASTAGFPASGTVLVETTGGLQTVTYTGVTATSFTGCTGGTGTMIGAQSYYWKGGFVGYLNTQAGINHSTQADPKNYGVMIRGCTNVTIDNCIVQNTYGDAIWIGQGGTNFALWSEHVYITRTKVYMSARDGIAIGQKAVDVHVEHCYVDQQYTQAFDTEPVGVGASARDVYLTNSYFGNWWGKTDLSRNNNISVTIAGGQSSDVGSPIDYARNYRIENCHVIGSIFVTNATDVVVARNRVVCDWTGNCYPGITVEFTNDDISIVDNFVYYRCSGFQGGIDVQYSGIGSTAYAPRNCIIRGNRVKVRNGAPGITVAGGGVEYSGVEVAPVTGTGTVAGTTVTDSGKAWTVNQFVGVPVMMDGAYGTISANTATTFSVSAWQSPLGYGTVTPANGTYQIFSTPGFIDVSGNNVDCTNDGNGQGGTGIEINANSAAGVRVSVHDNAIHNASTDAIKIDATFRASHLIELRRNKAWSTEGTATTNLINFNGILSNVTKLILDGNVAEGSIVPLAGLTSGTWLLRDGVTQEWTGYGVPNGVIAANIGSLYRRRDDATSASLWIKQSDEGANTGWVRLTAPQPLQWTVDQGSGIAVPASSTEWTNLITAAGLNGVVAVPNALWLCQEASGNLADSIGTFTLTAGGTGLSYQQASTVWARKALKVADGSTGAWANTDAGLPDVSASPITMVWFLSIAQGGGGAATKTAFQAGTGAGAGNFATVGGYTGTRVSSGANHADSATLAQTVIRPFWLRHNPGGSETKGGENVNKLAPTFAAGVTGKRIGLGGVGGLFTAPQVLAVYGFAWFGAISDANLKTILQQMGWVIDWT